MISLQNFQSEKYADFLEYFQNNFPEILKSPDPAISNSDWSESEC